MHTHNYHKENKKKDIQEHTIIMITKPKRNTQKEGNAKRTTPVLKMRTDPDASRTRAYKNVNTRDMVT